MDVVTLAELGLATAFGLVGVAEWTGRCRRKVVAYEAEESAVRAAGASAPPPPRPVPVVAEVPETHRAGTHLRRLVSAQGLLGVIFLPLLVLALLGNAYVTADAFAVALDRVPEPLVRVGEFEVTNFYMLGMLLSVALLILSGVLAEATHGQWVLRLLALLGIVSILAIEYCAAWERGRQLADAAGTDPTTPCLINLGIAIGTSVLETLAGFFTIHRMLLPLLLSVACAIGAPFRWLAFGLRLLTFRMAAPRTGLGLMTRIGSILDAIFEPLRALDRAIVTWWQRRRVRAAVSSERSASHAHEGHEG